MGNLCHWLCVFSSSGALWDLAELGLFTNFLACNFRLPMVLRATFWFEQHTSTFVETDKFGNYEITPPSAFLRLPSYFRHGLSSDLIHVRRRAQRECRPGRGTIRTILQTRKYDPFVDTRQAFRYPYHARKTRNNMADSP